MNKNHFIYLSLDTIQQKKFLESCHAYLRDLKGVPRMTYSKNFDWVSFFKIENFEFEKLDNLYYPIISADGLEDFLSYMNSAVIFDLARYDFTLVDELYQKAPSEVKKKFNLHLRHSEKNNFFKSNQIYFDSENYIVSKILKEKFLEIWKSKWGFSGAYFFQNNKNVIDAVIYE